MKNSIKLFTRHLSMVIVFSALMSTNVHATLYTMNLVLNGQNEVPPNGSPAMGTLLGTFDDVSNVLSFTLTFNGLVAPTTAAHFHGPADPGINGPVIIPLTGFPAGVTFGMYINSFTLSVEQASQLLCGKWYVNIHTAAYPGGEIRAQLKELPPAGSVIPIEFGLIGQNEFPPNTSSATGLLTGVYDQNTKLLSINLTFSGLLGTTTASHIHGPAAPGVNGPVLISLVGFPVGVTAGAYSNSFPLSPADESMLFNGLLYVNIHSTLFPGGEIRGQLTVDTLTGECGPPPIIPVANWALALTGLLILAFTIIMIRRRM